MRADLVGEQKNTTAAGEGRKHDRGRGSSTSETLYLTTGRAGLLSQHVGYPRATQGLIVLGDGEGSTKPDPGSRNSAPGDALIGGLQSPFR